MGAECLPRSTLHDGQRQADLLRLRAAGNAIDRLFHQALETFGGTGRAPGPLPGGRIAGHGGIGNRSSRNPVVDPFDAVTHLTPLDYIGTKRERRRFDLARRWNTRDFVTRFSSWATKYKRPFCFEYVDVVENSLRNIPKGTRFLPQVMPNWDNTPRSGQHGTVYKNSTPELFARYLTKAIAIVKDRPQREPSYS